MPGRATHDFYASPAIYDILHTPGTAAEVDALLGLVRRTLGDRRRLRILEPACGTGRYLRILAGRGHRVVGIDQEPAMVAYARARLARHGRLASVHCASMEHFAGEAGIAPGSIDLAFNPINSIRHLHSDAAMLAHLAEVARVLRPGAALYAVGVSITVYGIEDPSEDVWEGARGGCRVRQVVQYLPAPGGRGPGARLERVISHLTVRTSGRRGARSATHHLDSAYTLRSYDLRQWEALIGRSAMAIEAVVDESGRDFTLAPPGYAVFIMRPK